MISVKVFHAINFTSRSLGSHAEKNKIERIFSSTLGIYKSIKSIKMTVDLIIENDIHDYLFKRFESFVDSFKIHRNLNDCYDYIYNTLGTEDLLLDECRDLLSSHISEEMLIDIVLRTIDTRHLLEMLRDYFDYYCIEYCEECDTYWMDDEGEEHECESDEEQEETNTDPVDTTYEINSTIVSNIICNKCNNALPSMTMIQHLNGDFNKECPHKSEDDPTSDE